ncbi:MAG TPA: permease [Pseudonocardia sp.]|nr:permease [Pseudonocardia sp.]
MTAIGHALGMAGSMAWEILWALILGFALSAVIQAVIRRATIVRLLGDDRPRTLALAAGLGAASSSCSYAAVALARSLFRKGANFTAAMAFEIASTNLVIELGVILALLMGWQFTVAEFVGGPVMIVALAVLFRLLLGRRLRGRMLLEAAREQADRGLAGSMEGHAAMDMSVQGSGSFWRRLLSAEGFTSVSHVFVMEWAAIWRDLVIGLVVAGAISAWVPNSFWQEVFLSQHPAAAAVWGPLIGPLVAVLSFVCSIGNVPLAVVLWTGGISFGGAVAFIFADLIILPILNIYRRYYGTRMALLLGGTFYLTSAIAGYVVEVVFGALGWIPDRSTARLPDDGISWNYTTWLNIVFLLLAAALVIRFVRTGGLSMLRMMGGAPPADGEGHVHGGHDHGGHDHGEDDHSDHSDHAAHGHGDHGQDHGEHGHGERHADRPADPEGRDAHHVAREDGN